MVSCGFAKADPRQPGHDFLALQITGLWLTAERDHGPSGAGSEALTLDSIRENEIDESVLPSLTAEDLKELALALPVIAGRHFGSARGSSRDTPSPVSVSTRASTPVAAKTAALEAAGERRDASR